MRVVFFTAAAAVCLPVACLLDLVFAACNVASDPFAWVPQDEYNDLDLKINQEAFETLVKGGLDERLARHFAHLWIRDPLVIYGQPPSASSAPSDCATMMTGCVCSRDARAGRHQADRSL